MDPLLSAAAGGSREALGELARRYRPLVETYLRRRVGAHILRRDEVEDLAQEVFARVLPTLQSLPADATLDTFVGRLLRNAQWVIAKAADRAENFVGESAAASPQGDTPPPADLAPSIGPATLRDELDRVRALSERMSPAARRVLLGRLEGRTYAELADETGEPVDTVRKRFLRALQELRARIDERERPAND